MPKYSTPSKHNEEAQLSTPDTDLDNSSQSSSCSISTDSESSNNLENGFVNLNLEEKMDKVVMTDHRRLEVEGKLAPEPLLAENPGRFVLFPIQNPEVCFQN